MTRHLSPQRPPRLVELTVSYRTPAEVVALAAQVLAVAAPTIAPPRPVRQAGAAPRIVPATRGRAWPPPWPTWHGRRWWRSPRAGWPCWAPPSCSPSWPARWPTPASTRSTPATPRGDGLAAGLVVLPADETNGLEFDSVVVVEPSLVAAVGDGRPGEGPPVATTRGLRTLYVALTRPTQRLAVVHADPLPVELR